MDCDSDDQKPSQLLELNTFQSATTPLKSTWSQRTFSKIRPGSIRGSIFTLVSTAVGPGCLTLPGRMANSGIVLHLLVMIGVAFITYWSVLTIARAADRYNTYHFADLVAKALGPIWGILIDLIIAIYIYGIIIAFQIMIGEVVPSILGSLTLHKEYILERDLTMVVLNVAVMLPLGMFRNLSALRFVSLVSVISLVLVAVVLIAELAFFNHHYSRLAYFDVNLDLFSTYAVTLLTFVCHCNVPIIHKELVSRSVKRMSKVTFRAMLIVFCGYAVIALFGYLSVPEGPPSIIIQRSTPPGIHNDWIMVICRAIFVFTVIFAIPINAPPFRNSISKFLFKQEKPTFPLHICITLFLQFSTLVIAIFYPKIIFLFNFIGGFCGSFLALLIPGLLNYKLSGKSWIDPKNLLILSVSTLLTLVGFTSVILSIVALA